MEVSAVYQCPKGPCAERLVPGGGAILDPGGKESHGHEHSARTPEHPGTVPDMGKDNVLIQVNGETCTLSGALVRQRFMTAIYYKGNLLRVVHWTAESEAGSEVTVKIVEVIVPPPLDMNKAMADLLIKKWFLKNAGAGDGDR
jgi:hypothetical protein